MKCFNQFLNNLYKDLKAFIFWCGLFMAFRVAFILLFEDKLQNGIDSDAVKALWLGLRLSMKTAGVISLIGFVFASLPQIIVRRWPSAQTRVVWHSLTVIVFTICFMARLPFYQIFNSGFNMMLINGLYDDKSAILKTAVQEYGLLWRLPLALCLAGIISYLLYLWLEKMAQYGGVIDRPRKALYVSGFLIVALPVFFVFVRFGGAFSYSGSVNWENCARLKSQLLNEAILDDGQALYRVYYMQRALKNIAKIKLTEEELQEKFASLGGNGQAVDVNSAFLRVVSSPKLTNQPNNVVVVLNESLGIWPFENRFRNLDLVPNLNKILNKPDSASVGIMLAQGNGTITSVNAFLTGLPTAGVYENYYTITHPRKYALGIGHIMKKLGYKTVFWYGGFGQWQNVEKWALSQNFDEFICADSIEHDGNSPWGCEDKLLFDAVSSYIEKNGKNKTFHFILTTSNHPPYTVKVDKLGFDRKSIASKLPSDIYKKDNILTELGHIWYTDKVNGDFISKVKEKQPDTLFIITGDHSERFNFAKEQPDKTLSAIPCIFYGRGVKQEWFNEKSVGCHIQLGATLAEMIGCPGFEYSSLFPSIFEQQDLMVFNEKLFAKDGKVCKLTSNEKFVKMAKDAKLISAYETTK